MPYWKREWAGARKLGGLGETALPDAARSWSHGMLAWWTLTLPMNCWMNSGRDAPRTRRRGRLRYDLEQVQGHDK
jgi:hypothetical protein